MSVIVGAGENAAVPAIGPRAPRAKSATGGTWSRLSQYPSLIVGAAILVLYVVAGIVARFWTPFDPLALTVGPPQSPPDGEFWFGTDRLGRDIFSQTMYAILTDLTIAVVSVVFSFVIGTVIGTLSGFFRGPLDIIVQRFVEILQSFPLLLLALLIVAATGPGLGNVILVISIVGIPNYIRLSRAELMARRTSQYAEAAAVAGNRPIRIAFRHLLPNSIGPLIAYTSINASIAILLAASLGFIGVGLPPGLPEWGVLVSNGSEEIMSGTWWISMFPALAIVGLAVGFYLLGDGLSDLMDPRRKKR